MELKLLTLNVWRYYEWDKRKQKLIDFLKKQDADIVFIQEAAYDDRLKEKWKDQVDEINESLKYKNYIFSKLTDMKKWHKEPIDWIMYYGLGILSKYPIKKSEMVILPFVEKEKNFGFLHAVIDTSDGEVNIINVHFENTDKGSKSHLAKALEWCKERGINPIIAGDFNMKESSILVELADKEYDISYKIKEYISYMPTAFSNNDKPITLDYIISNKKTFKMKKVKCIKTSVSDHRPVLAFVEMK